MERKITWGAIVLEGAWSVTILVCGSDAGLTVPVLILLVYGAAALLVIWLARFLVHLVRTRRTPSERRYRLLWEPVFVLSVVIAVWCGAAFCVRFLISKPALDQYVQTLQAEGMTYSALKGEATVVGLFHLREAEVLERGVVRLITTRCMFDDCGMVYSPAPTPPPRIGEDSYSRLVGGWWHWRRSW